MADEGEGQKRKQLKDLELSLENNSFLLIQKTKVIYKITTT